MFSAKRLSASLDDMRRKVIVKRISRDLSRNGNNQLVNISPGVSSILAATETGLELNANLPHQIAQNKGEYIFIPEQDMSFATEKYCKELDIYNDELYKKSNKLYQDIISKLAGSNLELKSPPHPPPNPDNLHRLYHYRLRNRDRNCLHQTAAVCYLVNLGYKLTQYNKNTYSPYNNSAGNNNKIFEPYQAIELAAEISATRNENYMNAEQLLFEKLSIQDGDAAVSGSSTPTAPPPPAFNEDYNKLYPELYPKLYPGLYLESYNNQDSLGLEKDIMLTKSVLPDRRATAPAKLLPSVSHEIKQEYNLKCQTPEHHTVPEKINYFGS